jgi:nitric oxide reductase large subunit
MVALGWYYLTHPKASQHRYLLGFGCMLYAVLQHAIWNGSFGLQLLPAPIGPYLVNGVIGSGAFAFPSFLLVYVVESILMLTFFFFVTGKIRKHNTLTPPTATQSERQSASATPGFQQASARV